MTEQTTTRRGALGRALVLAAGAAGAGTAGAAAAGMPASVRLAARHVRVRGAAGHRYAALLDETGRRVGHLAGVSLPLHSPFAGPGPTAIELHTLTLDGGTLTAQGALTGAAGTFHVLGGTGRLGGVRGTYELCLDGPGGDAVLTFTTTHEGGW